MYMFFGDSHSRQFVGVSWGIFAHYVFSGATVKGLANTSSVTGHAEIIRHAVANGKPKTVFLMFGNVDFDFSLAREAVQDSSLNPESFIETRVQCYLQFATGLLRDAPERHRIRKLCILGPQISPLSGCNFFVQTPKHADVTESQLRAAAARCDLSDLARARLVLAFNDRLTAAFAGHPLADVLRIDRAMLEETGKIRDFFIPADPSDHHPVAAITREFWRPLLDRYITEHEISG